MDFSRTSLQSLTFYITASDRDAKGSVSTLMLLLGYASFSVLIICHFCAIFLGKKTSFVLVVHFFMSGIVSEQGGATFQSLAHAINVKQAHI